MIEHRDVETRRAVGKTAASGVRFRAAAWAPASRRTEAVASDAQACPFRIADEPRRGSRMCAPVQAMNRRRQ